MVHEAGMVLSIVTIPLVLLCLLALIASTLDLLAILALTWSGGPWQLQMPLVWSVLRQCRVSVVPQMWRELLLVLDSMEPASAPVNGAIFCSTQAEECLDLDSILLFPPHA